MSSRRWLGVLLLTLLVAAVLPARRLEGRSGHPGADANDAETTVGGGVATLYAHDPLAQTLCFSDGRFGHVIDDFEVKNRCSDVAFEIYVPGSLSTGIEGARVAAILDLGSDDELAKKYGFQRVGSGGHSFASLQRRDGKLWVRHDARSSELLELTNTDALFGKLKPSASAPVQVGHLYVLHISDLHDTQKNTFVKLIVVSYTPGDSVRFRWELL